MDYPWAIVGAKVVYIGPPMIVLIKQGPTFLMRSVPSPLSPDKIYTIGHVTEVPNGDIGIMVKEYPIGLFHVALFKPVEQKDSEMFNEWALDLPTDLVVEEMDFTLPKVKEPDHAHH